MQMPPDVLTMLLRGGHLNVPERKARGLWPAEPLAYSEVLDHLAGVLEREEWFPHPLPDHKPGDFVFEGIILRRLSPSRYDCHMQRPSVYNPYVVAEQSRRKFKSSRAAAEFYLKWELNLPGNLDSWIVE